MEALILACLAKDADDRPSAEQAQRRFGEASPTAVVAPEAAPEEPEPEPAPGTPRQPQRVRPAPTIASSTGRTARRGRGRGALAALAIVAVLAVIGAIALPSLLGGGGDTTRQNNPPNEQARAGGSNGEGGNENRGAGDEGGAVANTPQPTTPVPEETPARSDDEASQEEQQGGQQEPNDSPEQAAAQTIRDFYRTAAGPNYENSWNYLSSRYQQELGVRENMTDQFATLQSVEFTSGPSARVEGDTATVSFSTVAQHTNRTDTPNLTATLVNEDGEWKIDSL
jgi:eukaryotic-like serine/threonine-protein kinase